MVAIRKKGKYYYLVHSFRKDGRVLKKELYLGKSRPKNIEELKKRFIFAICGERWFSLFDEIKANFSKEQKTIPKSAREKEIETFMVRFTYDTNRIEGSKLTLRETADLLERGISPKAKPVRDVKEAEAHKKVFYEMLGNKKGLSLRMVFRWHKMLFEDTKPDIAGIVRLHQVAISGSKFVPPPPIEVPALVGEFFRWYERNEGRLHPVELAALAHLKFVTIHPFADGNGRICRLITNFVLHRHCFPMIDIPYEKRTSYYNALERAQTKNNESIFLHWFFKRYLKENEIWLTRKGPSQS